MTKKQRYINQKSEEIIMGILKSLKIINAGEGADKREPSYSIGGSANWCNHYGKQYAGSSKN